MWRNHIEEIIIALHTKANESHDFDVKEACIECIEIMQEVKISGVVDDRIWGYALALIDLKSEDAPSTAKQIYDITERALKAVLNTYKMV